MLRSIYRSARLFKILPKCVFSSIGGMLSDIQFVSYIQPKNCIISRRAFSSSTTGEVFETQIDILDLNEYKSISNEYLENLADSLEDLAETYPEIDCELFQGVMTLLISHIGTYVINKQPPNKQIWLSSPVSGPKRYDLVKGRWITLRDHSSLSKLLETEIGNALNQKSLSLHLHR